MKIPLIKRRGNFTRLASVIMSGNWSVGGADTSTPTRDPINPIKNRPPRNPMKDPGVENEMPAPTPRIIDTIAVITKEKRVDAEIIPHKMAVRFNGAVIWRSKPFSRVSHGRMTGLIALEVKKTVIEVIPVNNCVPGISRPMTQVKAMKKGNNNPNIKTGPLLK